MPKVVFRSFGCSLDGFGAGLQQSQSEPFGKNAIQIMNWFFPTQTFKSMRGGEKGSTGLDDSYAARAFEGVGASIMGRNMFSPLRGPWADEEWKGWWGGNPPFKHPVFVDGVDTAAIQSVTVAGVGRVTHESLRLLVETHQRATPGP